MEASGEESWSGGGSSAGLVAKMVWVMGSGTSRHRERAECKGWGRAKGRDRPTGGRGGRGEQRKKNKTKQRRPPRRRGTQKKDKKAKHESREQTVPEGGVREEWVECEWVSTCVLGLDLDLDLACKMLARFA